MRRIRLFNVEEHLQERLPFPQMPIASSPISEEDNGIRHPFLHGWKHANDHEGGGQRRLGKSR